jgi:hypothetical protein
MCAAHHEALVSRVVAEAAETVTLDELGHDVLPHLRELLGALEEAGTTDFLWAPCPVEGDADAIPRTRAYLSKLARGA